MVTGEQSPNALHDRASAEVEIIDKLLPGYLPEGLRICSSAWFAFACEEDDIIESLSPEEGITILCDCIEIMQGRETLTDQGTSSKNRRVVYEYTY